LYQGVDEYALAESISIVKEAKSNLIKKVNNKIKYYGSKNNKKGISSLSDLLEDLNI